MIHASGPKHSPLALVIGMTHRVLYNLWRGLLVPRAALLFALLCMLALGSTITRAHAQSGGVWSAQKSVTDPFWDGDLHPVSLTARAQLDLRCFAVFGASDAVINSAKNGGKASSFTISAFRLMTADYTAMKRSRDQTEAEYYSFKSRYMKNLRAIDEDMIVDVLTINSAQCRDYLKYRNAR